VLDLLAEGRQTVLPPSRHPSGCDYRWTGPDALEDVDPGELPELPADITERLAKALRPFGYQAEPERLPRSEVGEIDYNDP
jgi:Bifunctional DNA primase/polymerase, N-terminal